MTARLEGKRIAVLATDGFEQTELETPLRALLAEHARVDIVAPDGKSAIRGWRSADWGDVFEVDRNLSEADPSDYDGLLLPGGVMNPDRLRENDNAVAFVSAFLADRRPLAAICHAPWLLIEADGVAGRRVTSVPSVRTDLRNAGAHWVDEPVVRDENLVTSRGPRDLDAFLRAAIETIDTHS